MKHIVTRFGKKLGLTMTVGIVVGLVGISPVQAATSTTSSTAASAAMTNAPDEECVTTGSASNTEVKMEACSYSEASRNIDVTLQDRATASGQIQLSYFNPNASAWSKAKALKCKRIYVSIKWGKSKIKRKVNANKRKVNGTWCVRLKHGSTWANSGKNGNITVPFTATVRGGWSLMTLKNVRKGIWGHKGEFRNGQFWQVCDNEWKIGLKPDLQDTDVLMVRSEADVVYRNKTELVTNGSVKVEGSLSCPAGTLYGSASASANARDYLWIYVRAASAAAAKIEAARQAEANTAAWAKLHVSAQQSQEVSAHAKIHLECSEAPQPVDNPPTMTCTVPEHIFVGDDAMWADFDLTDPDGDPVSFNEPVLTGPIEKTTTDLSNVSDGKRLSVKFRAQDIPAGTSQSATIKVTGSAGGKSVSCSGTVIVENNHTGW